MSSALPIAIRLATLEDAPAIRKLIFDSVRGLSTNYYSTEQIESALVHVFGVDTQLVLDGTYFIAECEGEIAGSGGWSKRKTLFGGDQRKSSEPEPLLDPATEPARIRAFYIHPRWSRKGVGSLILSACENAARESGFSRVELASTLPGVPFYATRGYEKGEEIQIEMPNGQLLVIRMSKELAADERK